MRLDLLPEGPGVCVALGPPLVQVGPEVVELGPAVLPLPLEQVLRPRGVGQQLDGAVGHAELALDRASAVAGSQQCVDGGVLGAGAVGEPVSGGPRRPVLGRCRRVLWCRLGEGRAEARAVARDASLSRFAEVAPEVEPIGNLDGGGRANAGALGEEWGAIAADDLDPRMIGQPGRDGASLAIRQQVHRPAGLDVDQHGPVDTSLAHRVLVDARYTRDRWLWFRESVDQPQDRVPADSRADDVGQPGTGAAGQGEADPGQHRPQSFGPLAVPPGQARDLLDERPPLAGDVFAREPPDTKSQHNPPPRHGEVRRKPQIRAMHPLGPATAARTPRPGRPASDTETDHFAIVLHRLHPDPQICQEEQLFQPEQYLAHSPEPSARTPQAPALSRRSREAHQRDHQSQGVATPQKLDQNPFSPMQPPPGSVTAPRTARPAHPAAPGSSLRPSRQVLYLLKVLTEVALLCDCRLVCSLVRSWGRGSLVRGSCRTNCGG